MYQYLSGTWIAIPSTRDRDDDTLYEFDTDELGTISITELDRSDTSISTILVFIFRGESKKSDTGIFREKDRTNHSNLVIL